MTDPMASDHERLGDLLAAGLDHHRAGRRAEAAKAYRAALALIPGQPDALHLLGLLAHDQGDVEGAIERIAAAVAARPDVVPFRTSLARIVAATTDRRALRRALARAHSRHPDSAIVSLELGNACRQDRSYALAALAYEAALAADPTLRDAALHLSAVELQRGRRDAATAALRAAVAHHPDDVGLQARFGNLLRAGGHLDEAVEVLSAVAARHPDQAGVGNDLGIALREKGRLVSARRVLERASALAPKLSPVWINLSNVLRDLGEAEAAGNAIERAIALAPEDRSVGQNRLYHAHYRRRFDGDAERRAAMAWGSALPASSSPADFPNPRDPDRVLTVGFVSADFREHPVGTFLSGIWPSIDRKRYRIMAYDAGHGADATTERLQRSADGWLAIAGLDDAAAIERVRADAVDILIDLSGHTAGHRLGIFAHRAAPVQATWLGYFGTTGVPAMDYLIADHVTVPPVEARWYSERVWRLPSVHVAFGVPEIVLDPGPLPMGPDRPPTFGCFNSLAKLSDRTIALWARVFAAVPGARLLLKARQLGDGEVAAAITGRLAAVGIPPGAVTCEGPSSREAYFARYRDIDMVLDTWPFGGGTTTAEAMWMGVPSVRLRGDRFAGRFGETFLQSAGLHEFVAADEDAYVACAVDWSRRRDDLADLRAILRQKLFASPAGDVATFARDLEACWRTMWRERCAAG